MGSTPEREKLSRSENMPSRAFDCCSGRLLDFVKLRDLMDQGVVRNVPVDDEKGGIILDGATNYDTMRPLRL
jgi:hypothetical protein